MSNRILWLLFIVLFLLSLGNAFLFGYLYEKATHIEERIPSSRIIGYGDSIDGSFNNGSFNNGSFDLRPHYEKHN
jgi:hypothetical protein